MNKCDRCLVRKASIILIDEGKERLCDSCFNNSF
ncbi:DUF7685 domain-containing protein [Mesobacillus jeotgali]